MKIASNIFSPSAQRSLGRTTRMLQISLERLSSGRRINSAKDDAAGLAMSTRLGARILGTAQAIRNANDGMSMLSVADSAMNEMTSILQSMRELAIQAANGTISSDQRSAINNQVAQLMAEYDRIANETEFNGSKLLDGTFKTKALQIGTEAGQQLDISIANIQKEQVFQKTVGTGTLKTNPSYSDSNLALSISTADLNGDGSLDVLAGSGTEDSIILLTGNGDGTLKPSTAVPLEGTAVSITTADLNKDGVLDIIAASDDGAVNVALGNGDGTFKPKNSYFVAPSLYVNDVETSDLNGDGFLDIVASCSDDDFVAVLIGNGNGSFQPKTSIPAGDCISSIALADLNGDQIVDLVTGSFNDSAINVCLGRGDGTFASKTSYSSGDGVTSVQTADLNQDGILDIVSTSINDGTLYIFLGKGDGTFNASTSFAAGMVYSIATMDLNSDGITDLLAECLDDNTMNVLLGNGNGSFKAKVSYSLIGAPLTTTNFSTTDLNKDGVPDVVTGTDSGIQVSLGSSISATAVGDMNLTSSEKASSALSIIDEALVNLNRERTSVGIAQNRLEPILSNLYSNRENLSTAYSSIVDADIAQETAELVRQQIIQQAGIAMLSQANAIQSRVLELL